MKILPLGNSEPEVTKTTLQSEMRITGEGILKHKKEDQLKLYKKDKN